MYAKEYPEAEVPRDDTAAEPGRPATPGPPAERRDRLPLIPRYEDQGYAPELVARRRAWIEERTGCRLEHAGSFSIPSEAMRGNVENPIGAAQTPLGVAGPLELRGEHAQGTFFVPLATTEGALVRSYERGMVAITRAGGAEARVVLDANRVCPLFAFDGVAAAAAFAAALPGLLPEVRAEAEATTRHGRLLELIPRQVGRDVVVEFRYSTGDAHGMNMITRATDRACRWLARRTAARSFTLMSGAEGEKRAAGSLLAGGKGKTAVAGVRLPRRVVHAVLATTPEALAELWRRTVVGHLASGALGYNGHAANGLTALFIACGQDVANAVNSATAITTFEVAGGDLHAAVTLPSLTVATVGGGTGQGTARECLEMLGCAGDGGAPKLAEIAAATVLAGELSFGAALAAGGFVDAHETYGRNRPNPQGPGEGE
jgi:hydroxymethylglutaryl-CoA reductase (NADPH)